MKPKLKVKDWQELQNVNMSKTVVKSKFWWSKYEDKGKNDDNQENMNDKNHRGDKDDEVQDPF